MIPLERTAEREILNAVRKEMDSLFGQRDGPTAANEERLAELVRIEIARWQRARVNGNLPVLPDVAAMEIRVMNWLVGLGPLEPPMVDARLADGSRLNVVIPPVSQQHTVLTIRTFRPDVDTLERLVELGTITQELATFLRAAVHAYLNIVVSGPTGSGKTTLLNALGNETDGTGRMIVIEQTRELKLPDLVPLCVSLEAQEENAEGVGEIEQRELVRNALRMRPRRIIVGETRGAETWDMLRAMNTGHGGCLSSVHANSPRDALDALITLGMMAPERPPEAVMARLIARSISLVIQMAEEPGTGRRLLTDVLEISGLEGNTIQGHDLWLRDEVSGRLEWTGTPPRCMAEFAKKGVPYAVPSAPVLSRTNGALA